LAFFLSHCTIPETEDIAPPTVNLIFPVTGSVVSGNIVVTVQASDDRDISQIWYTIDGEIIERSGAARADFQLDLAPYADDRDHVFQAGAVDKSDNNSVSAQAIVTVSKTGDVVFPTVVITNPLDGQEVVDSTTVIADAQDDRYISEVAFFVNGDSVARDLTYPYHFIWSVTEFPRFTSQSIYARAFDGARNRTNSDNVSVTIVPALDQVPPTVEIRNPLAGQQVVDTTIVIADAQDNNVISEVAFFVNGDSVFRDLTHPYEFVWSVTDYPDFTEQTVYARAFDGARNRTNSDDVTINVVPSIDQVVPTARLLYPLAGQTLFGIVRVQVEAADDRELDRVDFFIDGILEFSADASSNDSPFAYSWDTRGYQINSQHSLYFKAIDAAGNESENDAILFTIGGPLDAEPPTIVVLYPQEGDTLTGTVTVSVDVTDNVGVDRVEYYVDGGEPGTGLPNYNYVAVAPPWSFDWDTNDWADTNEHTLYIRAVDTSQNESTLGPLVFTIF
jgi:hypothetical protein